MNHLDEHSFMDHDTPFQIKQGVVMGHYHPDPDTVKMSAQEYI